MEDICLLRVGETSSCLIEFVAANSMACRSVFWNVFALP